MDKIEEAIAKYLSYFIPQNKGTAIFFAPHDVLKWYNYKSVTIRNKVLTRYVLDASSALGISLYRVVTYRRGVGKYYNAYVIYEINNDSYAWRLALRGWHELYNAIRDAVEQFEDIQEKARAPAIA